jgi:hypothetical protein
MISSINKYGIMIYDEQNKKILNDLNISLKRYDIIQFKDAEFIVNKIIYTDYRTLPLDKISERVQNNDLYNMIISRIPNLSNYTDKIITDIVIEIYYEELKK